MRPLDLRPLRFELERFELERLELERLLRVRALAPPLVLRFLAAPREPLRLDVFREDDADLRPERAAAPRLDVPRELVDLLPAFFLPRPVDFFVAAIDILSLLYRRVRSVKTAYSM